MFKFLVIGVVLSLQLGGILGGNVESIPVVLYRVGRDIRTEIEDSKNRDADSPPEEPQPIINTVSPADQDSLNNLARTIRNIINVPAAAISRTELSSSVNVVGKELSSEYLVTRGIGAHKLHLRKEPWNKAREICIEEGGNLADIKSDSEEKIVLRMLVEASEDTAWIGYHDMFEEGDWVSVLGEPLGKSGWDRWWKKRLPNPDNQDGNEDCATLMKDGGGMNDNNCSRKLPFVCKITAL